MSASVGYGGSVPDACCGERLKAVWFYGLALRLGSVVLFHACLILVCIVLGLLASWLLRFKQFQKLLSLRS